MRLNFIRIYPIENYNNTLENLRKDSKEYLHRLYTSNNLDNRNTKLRLLKIENFLQKTYNTKLSIYTLINKLFDNIEINIKDKAIILYDFNIDTVSSQDLYNIITYGNLEVKGCDIFKRVFNYAKIQKAFRREVINLWQ